MQLDFIFMVFVSKYHTQKIIRKKWAGNSFPWMRLPYLLLFHVHRKWQWRSLWNRQGMGEIWIYWTGLCASKLHYSFFKVWALFLSEFITLSWFWFGFFLVHDVLNSFFNDTLHYKWMALETSGISIFTPTKKFTWRSSIQSWHSVIAIKQGQPLDFFCTNYRNKTFIHIKKISFNLLWPTHFPNSSFSILKPFITSPTPSPDYRSYK